MAEPFKVERRESYVGAFLGVKNNTSLEGVGDVKYIEAKAFGGSDGEDKVNAVNGPNWRV